MRLARITGRVSASIKSAKLTGVRMLVADYVDPEGEVLERAAVVTDACGAGPGDLVLVAVGSAARVPAETAGVPTDATAVGFIDQLSVGARNVDLAGPSGPLGPPAPPGSPEPTPPPSPSPAEAARPARSSRQRRK